jgi:putative tryptophan/tyrosine transport system substrate-binding protein
VDRRRFLLTSLAGALAAPLAARAQQVGKRAKIGFLVTSPLPDHEALLNGLNDLGYVEGRNISIERRNAEGQRERLSDLAADLVRAGVNVIVAQGHAGARAAGNATTSIPIVFVALSDPVDMGIVVSLARPGGNVTGVSLAAAEISGKHLELLKNAVPKMSRVAVLTNSNNRNLPTLSREVEVAARRLGVRIQFVDARVPADLDAAFAEIFRGSPGGLLVQADPTFFGQRTRIIEFANQRRLPAIYTESALWAREGGLMAYGPSLAVMYRHAASYVDKILRGARPADLPVERPTKFEFVINLKTAKALGLTIPPSLLARADQIIE